MTITISAYKLNKNLPLIDIQFKENEEWASIEMTVEDQTYSIPIQKFISILSLLVEEKETENLRKQIAGLQNQIHCIKSKLLSL